MKYIIAEILAYPVFFFGGLVGGLLFPIAYIVATFWRRRPYREDNPGAAKPARSKHSAY